MKYIAPILFFLLLSIQHPAYATGDYLYRCNEKLIEVIMEDIFNPPVASRIHVYPNIAAYEVLCKKERSMNTLCTQLNQLDSIPDPETEVDYSLSAFTAFTTVAKRLVYSEYMISNFEDTEYAGWLQLHQNNFSLFLNSVSYGKKVAQHIIAWLKKDNYDYTRTLSRYVLLDKPSNWRPTGPEYMNALEPNWPLMRSFVFDSLTMIKPVPNIEYSEKKNSVYYKNAMAVYKQSLSPDTTFKFIATYWDDNANVAKSAGHLTYFIHKVTPGGHWIRIAGQAVRQLGLDEFKSAKLYTLVTLSIFEGFLSCWTEKFVSDAVRPETYINRLIAPQWKPFIETPPFPEYTSGHSVVSSAAATILTAVVPQPYSFTDSSEVFLGLPPRKFNSFREASDEASISRFYGGIHYMPALNEGAIQGRRIAESILKKIKLETP